MKRKTLELLPTFSKLLHHTSSRPSLWTQGPMGDSVDMGYGHHHLWESFWFPGYDLECSGLTYTADLQWNRVSGLRPSGPEVGTLPLGYQGPHTSGRCVGTEILNI
ncbi:hypothetical protein AVEN_114153-1 [Araneus ventricosus]|uniref:Uncharacterized protein n=1 Tax=Araneus ventricosus TaxID=182803 RepID=A0A4Y2V4G4_ARAVE|nr:hypothetical protein AVEN_115563-1 [Araneus ventricosus]GBO20133.1 hypothetical protein AVEN_41014-1 [Araneus ventricosus]GBO22273.1 hypothetical protein AVEN_59116-1 [Araneus ventricosus]GBO22280.1 hypothetical protein AVEN_114153-1 [Araneus ventricosus]